MKKRLLSALTIGCFAISAMFAEDIISMRDGTIVKAIVQNIGTTEITYKKASNPDGPNYTALKSDVLSILYANGEAEKFGEAAKTDNNPQQAPSEQRKIAAIPAADNETLKRQYADVTIKHKNNKPNGKPTKYYLPVFGFTKNSVISDSLVQISFTLAPYEDYYGKKQYPDQKRYLDPHYAIAINNKSDQNIYVDVANSFRIYSDGRAESFLPDITVTTNSGSSSGGSVNLGSVTGALGIGGIVGTLASGLNVGGGNSNNVSITKDKERVMMIPPHSFKWMPPKIVPKDNGKKVEECYEYFSHIIIPNDYYKWQNKYEFTKIDYSLESAKEYPVVSYQIAYSTSHDFNQYTILDFSVIVTGMFGCGGATYYPDLEMSAPYGIIGWIHDLDLDKSTKPAKKKE